MIATPQYLRRSRLMPWPAPFPEVRLVAALADYPAARHTARRLGLKPDCLTSGFSREVVRQLVDDSPISPWVASALHEHDDDCPSWKGAIAVCHRLGQDGTGSESAALAAVAAFMGEVADKQLAEQFRWAAERVECGQYSPRDRDELDAVQDAARVTRRGAA